MRSINNVFGSIPSNTKISSAALLSVLLCSVHMAAMQRTTISSRQLLYSTPFRPCTKFKQALPYAVLIFRLLSFPRFKFVYVPNLAPPPLYTLYTFRADRGLNLKRDKNPGPNRSGWRDASYSVSPGLRNTINQ